MPTLDVYSNLEDLRITGGPSSSYASARDGTGGLLSSDNEDIRVGQNVGYYVYRGYLSFDTSSIPDDAVIGSVTLSLWVQADYTTNDFNVELWKYDWKYVPNGTGVGTGNLRQYVFQLVAAGANNGLAAVKDNYQLFIYPLEKTLYMFKNLDTGWINKSGYTKYVLRSQQDTLAIAPTASEWIKFLSRDSGGIYSPQLTVGYSVPSNNPNFRRIHSGTLSPVPFQEIG